MKTRPPANNMRSMNGKTYLPSRGAFPERDRLPFTLTDDARDLETDFFFFGISSSKLLAGGLFFFQSSKDLVRKPGYTSRSQRNDQVTLI